jgi:glycogen(starch) synthase
MKKRIKDTVLVESAWEVCNQVGGIYTVIRSKVRTMQENWGDDYFLVGPYFEHQANSEFEEYDVVDERLAPVIQEMRDKGMEVHYGRWLVNGNPNVILLNPFSVYDRLGDVKYSLWKDHDINGDDADDLLNQVCAFGYMLKEFSNILTRQVYPETKVLLHVHEWMAGASIPMIRKEGAPVGIVFTTHATLLGRYLAQNDGDFYNNLPFYNWHDEAKHFNIEFQAKIERAAAHGANTLSTVSDVTGRECLHLLGREPDAILPNGLNIQRFTALHEFQNLHLEYKNKLHEFTMGHFFPSYAFDLDKTVYMFTSGRYEYRNKGYDLVLESMARLNHRLKEAGSDVTVIMFVVTRRPFHTVNPLALETRAGLDELRNTIDKIKEQVGERLLIESAASPSDKMPDLKPLVDDYWRMRYRRAMQSFHVNRLPLVVTHNMVDNDKDEVLNFVRTANLLNHEHDRVKIVYHPDFIHSGNHLFGLEYNEFVRGCHLGVFPSFYEPWGYTPLECIASGVPTVTSDTSGFGDYARDHVKNPSERGVMIIDRRYRSFDDSAFQLSEGLYRFLQQDRRARIKQRNQVESLSMKFDWRNLYKYYEEAYVHAMKELTVIE